MLNNDNVSNLIAGIQSFFAVQEYKNIIDFALQDVDLSDDVSSAKSKIDLENYPYLVQPLQNLAIEKGKRKQVVIAFPEQMGKSLLMMLSVLYNVTYSGQIQALITFPSIDLAVETAGTKFIPIFRKIPQFREQIDKPFAIRSDRLKLSNALIYWLGAGGSRISSRSSSLVVGDEVSIWETPNGVNQIEELKKRTRSYNECLQLFVSTPRYKQDNFWREFLLSSQGFYFLRCQHCGGLTMRSCDIHNLQFDTVFNEDLKQYVAVRGSERLICPKCNFEHGEALKPAMIKQGGFIHQFPDKIGINTGYQCGVLASLLNVHCWGSIADIQLQSGKTAELSDYVSFDNSIRGLPYQEREYNKQGESAISTHYFKPADLKRDDIQAVFVIADTQDTFSPCAVIAYTRHDNLFVLEVSRPRFLFLDDEQRKVINAENQRNGKPPEKTLLDIINGEYYGIKPLCAIVDMYGHRTDEVKAFSRLQRNILLYAGTNLKFEKFKVSENIPKLFLCDSRKFQADLIFKLYFQKNRESNFLFLPETLTEQDIEQITSFQPDREKRNGNLYQNWTPGEKVHDIFDVLKMGIAITQIAPKIYRKDRFLLGEAKGLKQARNAVKKPANSVKTPVAGNPLFKRY